MVSFKQFIVEREGMPFDELVSQIKKKCQPFLSENISAPLFRGININHLKAGYTVHPQGRKPADSDAKLNFMFNAGFQITYGVPSIRTRTVFATGSFQNADQFGAPAFFFPSGEYRFAWSPYIFDSHMQDDSIWEMLAAEFKELSKDMFEPDHGKWKESLQKLFERLEIQPHKWVRGDDDAVRMTEQIAKYYFSLQVGNLKGFGGFHQLLDEALGRTFERLYVDDMNLEGAVKSHSEIFFYQTDGYYLVPIDLAAEVMNERNPTTKAIYDWLLEQLKT